MAASEEKPKPIPPPATPVRFPTYSFAGPPNALSNEPGATFTELQQLFKIRRLTELTPAHLRALGLFCRSPVPVDELVPTAFLPPLEGTGLGDDINTLTDAESQEPIGAPGSKTLSNGRPRPDRYTFALRIRELRLDPDDVYDNLARRSPRPGRRPVSVAHFRRFWTALQFLGGYWDTSQDDAEHGYTEAAQRAANDRYDFFASSSEKAA